VVVRGAGSGEQVHGCRLLLGRELGTNGLRRLATSHRFDASEVTPQGAVLRINRNREQHLDKPSIGPPADDVANDWRRVFANEHGTDQLQDVRVLAMEQGLQDAAVARMVRGFHDSQ
jgi:hypothetical protein